MTASENAKAPTRSVTIWSATMLMGIFVYHILTGDSPTLPDGVTAETATSQQWVSLGLAFVTYAMTIWGRIRAQNTITVKKLI